MSLKYSLSPCDSFLNLILEDLNSGRCLVVMTFSDRKLADCALENANSFLNHFEFLEKGFSRCETSEGARVHLYYCFGFLSALMNFLTFTSAERLFVESYFFNIYEKRIGEIKYEACE